MTLSQGWKYGFEAFKEAANLIGLTILVVAASLTVDTMLFAIGLAAEIVYLFWASRSPRYYKRVEYRTKSRVQGVDFLDRILLIVSTAGIVVILFFGFGKHLLSHPWPYLTHAGGWEAGAIVWTGLFLFYYVAKFRDISNRPVNTFIKAFILLLSGWLLREAWHSMERPIPHVIYVTAIGLCFLCTDLLIMKFHTDEKEKSLSKASLIWADIPMVTAFIVLGVYLRLHGDTEHPDVFVSGVVTCQLLISNAVFVVMEFGLLQSPK